MRTLIIPEQIRVYIYGSIALISLVIGAVQVGYAALEAPQPDWLTVALAVVPFLAAGLGATAATHTPAPEDHE